MAKPSDDAVSSAVASPVKTGMELVRRDRQVIELRREFDELCKPLPADAKPEDVLARSEAERLDKVPREIAHAEVRHQLAIIADCDLKLAALDEEAARAKVERDTASAALDAAYRANYAAQLRYNNLAAKCNAMHQRKRSAEGEMQYWMRVSPDALKRWPEQRREHLEQIELLRLPGVAWPDTAV